MNLKQYKYKKELSERFTYLILDDVNTSPNLKNKRTTLKGIVWKRASQSLKDKWKSIERFHYSNYEKGNVEW